MTEKKRKTLYWVFKLLGILISCALPIWAICERFPIWTEKHDAGYSIGVGAILILVVLLVVLFSSVAIGFADGVAAIASLVAVAIYYVALYLTRKIFERKIEFTIFKEF
jgi:hypothetical protein